MTNATTHTRTQEDALIEPAEMADLLTIQLKRSRLEAWHREPFFEESVRGCVVRIVHGTYMDDKGNQHGNYHLMKISDIREKGSYRYVIAWSGKRVLSWDASTLLNFVNFACVVVVCCCAV